MLERERVTFASVPRSLWHSRITTYQAPAAVPSHILPTHLSAACSAACQSARCPCCSRCCWTATRTAFRPPRVSTWTGAGTRSALAAIFRYTALRSHNKLAPSSSVSMTGSWVDIRHLCTVCTGTCRKFAVHAAADPCRWQCCADGVKVGTAGLVKQNVQHISHAAAH
jgi:hypothetical protein